jgi:hypothetical protein
MLERRRLDVARRHCPPGRQLTTDEIIQKVIEIIGKNEQGHYKASAFDIKLESQWIKDSAENITRIRSRLSKKYKPAIKQFAAYLRKRVGDLPEDFVVASGLLSVLRYSEGYAGAFIKPKRGDAIEKKLAMEAALHLCEKFDIEPTGTRDGSACKIGAILYGNENADLRKHYVEVRSERRLLERDVRKAVKESEQLETEESEGLKRSKNPPSTWQMPLLHEVSMWTRDGQYLFVSPWWAAPKQDGWHRVPGQDREHPTQHACVPLIFPLLESSHVKAEVKPAQHASVIPPPPRKTSRASHDGPDAMAEYKAKQQAELDKTARLRAMRLAKKPGA